jgi:hypothetical protein
MMSDLSNNLNNNEDSSKTYASICMLIGCSICTILCICGLYNQISSSSSVNVTARITQVNLCTPQVNNNITNYSCNLQVTYLVNNISYTNNITLQNTIKYSLNDNVNISYDSSNPNKIGPPVSDNKITGSVSIVIASLIICSCTVSYFLSSSKSQSVENND